MLEDDSDGNSCARTLPSITNRERTTKSRRAVAPIIALDQPGRLRLSNLQALFAVSHTTIYQRIRSGLLPQPDGWDLPGRPKGERGRPYWKTETIKALLEA